MNKENYDDIINLPHHESDVHPHMPIADRAAQFSPFSALTGYENAVSETARLTDERIELDEYEKAKLNEKLTFIAQNPDVQRLVTVTFFVGDALKSGGRYVTTAVNIRRVDELGHALVTPDNERIEINDIIDIEF